MKRYMLAVAALTALSAGAAVPANAVEFGAGPGGVYVGPDRDRGYGYESRDQYRSYDQYRGNCRVLITHRTNRAGEDVVVRRRICD